MKRPPPVPRHDSQWIRTPTHPQTFWPKICPTYKICRDKDGAEIEGTANHWLAQLETHPMDKHQSLKLLTILCYACRQKPSISVSWEALPSSWLEQTQIPTAKHWTEVRVYYGRVSRMIEGPEAGGNSTERPTESTNLHPRALRDWATNQRA